MLYDENLWPIRSLWVFLLATLIEKSKDAEEDSAAAFQRGAHLLIILVTYIYYFLRWDINQHMFMLIEFFFLMMVVKINQVHDCVISCRCFWLFKAQSCNQATKPKSVLLWSMPSHRPTLNELQIPKMIPQEKAFVFSVGPEWQRCCC